VENKFSVLKIKFSGNLKARRFRILIREIANKVSVCNIHGFLLFLSVEVFYRAEFLAPLKPFTIFAYLAHIVGMVTVKGFDLMVLTETNFLLKKKSKILR
jgi:hypothetical protein